MISASTRFRMKRSKSRNRPLPQSSMAYRREIVMACSDKLYERVFRPHEARLRKRRKSARPCIGDMPFSRVSIYKLTAV
jgi:hypothetical protein